MRSVDFRSRRSGGGRSVASGAAGAQPTFARGDGPYAFEAKKAWVATLEATSELEGRAR